jgi:hypothetical protein
MEKKLSNIDSPKASGDPERHFERRLGHDRLGTRPGRPHQEAIRKNEEM